MSIPKHIQEHAVLGVIAGANPTWPSVESGGKQFAAGIADITSSANFTHNPAFGWYCQAFIMPKETGTITGINVEAGSVGGSGTANRIGWALYDGKSLAQLDSGVYTLATGSVSWRNISGVSAAFSNRSVILALLGGQDGVGNDNFDMVAVDNAQQVLGLPQVHSASEQRVIVPWVSTNASPDYTNAPATLTKTTLSAVVNKIHRCSLSFT